MSSSDDVESLKEVELEKVVIDGSLGERDPDEEFGGHEAREKLERKLLRKLDLRMSILVVIYILNYVSTHPRSSAKSRLMEVL